MSLWWSVPLGLAAAAAGPLWWATTCLRREHAALEAASKVVRHLAARVVSARPPTEPF